jgi:hypothetical protein
VLGGDLRPRSPLKVRGRSELEVAVREARRIRSSLVRLRRRVDLGGDCALASVLLAVAILDVGTLRHTEDTSGRRCTPHVWNEVDGVIVDVTATQFNNCTESVAAGEPAVFGLLVARVPRVYHRPVAGRGQQTLAYLRARAVGWYEGQDHRRFRAAIEELRRSLRLRA